MEQTMVKNNQREVISPTTLLAHWQGHRKLTRKVIEAFPEKEFFELSIGGMRTPAQIILELLGIAAPGVREIATGNQETLREELHEGITKKDILDHWDRDTDELDRYFNRIPIERFGEQVITFGQYPGTVISSILYFIDNEIHHRGQLYVYLRSLGIEPPMFWER